MRTSKILYLPKVSLLLFTYFFDKELENPEVYPLEIITDFLYLALPVHSVPQDVRKNLRISTKVFCRAKEYDM